MITHTDQEWFVADGIVFYAAWWPSTSAKEMVGIYFSHSNTVSFAEAANTFHRIVSDQHINNTVRLWLQSPFRSTMPLWEFLDKTQ